MKRKVVCPARYIPLCLVILLAGSVSPAFCQPATVTPVSPVAQGPVPQGLSCTAETLNLSGFVGSDGSVVVFNVPADQGDVRLRVTCEDPFGDHLPGESPLVTPIPDGETVVPEILFDGVTPIATRLSVVPSSLRLVGAGSSQPLAVAAVFEDDSSGDVTAAAAGTTYSTSNPAVASVSPGGVVTAQSTGTAVVGALNEGAVGFASISVLSASLQALEVTPPQVELVISSVFGTPQTRLGVTGRLSDGTVADLSGAASGTTYASSDPAVAAVGLDGALVGLAAGTATITVTNGALEAQVQVEVTQFDPTPVLALNTPGFAHEADVTGSLIFVADGSGGLQIFDAAGSAPIPGVPFPGESAVDVKLRGDLAAVALETGGVALLDVADPLEPVELARIATGGSARDLWLSGDRLFIATGTDLEVHDLTVPETPVLLGRQSFGFATRAVAADSSRGVAVVVTAQPAAEVVRLEGAPPWPAVRLPLPAATNQADDAAIFGTSAFVANGRAGLHEVDLTDPSAPALRAATNLDFNALGVAVRQSEQGLLIAAADNRFVNAVPLFDAALRNVFTVDFSTFPGTVRADANSTGVALGDSFGVVTTGPDGIQIFRTRQLTDNAGIPPVVSITSPLDGGEVPAGVPARVQAVATDDVQVAAVDFLLDGQVVASDATQPFAGVFQAGPPNTTHLLQARALDLGGNLGESLPVTVTTTTVPEQVMAQVGQINDLNHLPRTIVLDRVFDDPVVLAQPISFNGGDTAVVRIVDVQPDRFTLFIHEAPDRDGPHTLETVSYLVLEAGRWRLTDGTRLEASKLTTGATVGVLVANQWVEVSLASPFQGAPAVMTQVQTNHDPAWVKTRQTEITATGFRVALEREEAATSPHGPETIGWLAIEPGTGLWGTQPYAAVATPEVVTDSPFRLDFAIGPGAAPLHIIASLASYNGNNNANLRYRELEAGSVTILLREDTTLDPETGHAAESVHALIVGGGGLLSAQPGN